MNGYVCFWKGKQCEVHAETSYEAQQKAIKVFQNNAGRHKVKSYDVTAVIAEKNGEQVTHTAVD